MYENNTRFFTKGEEIQVKIKLWNTGAEYYIQLWYELILNLLVDHNSLILYERYIKHSHHLPTLL